MTDCYQWECGLGQDAACSFAAAAIPVQTMDSRVWTPDHTVCHDGVTGLPAAMSPFMHALHQGMPQVSCGLAGTSRTGSPGTIQRSLSSLNSLTLSLVVLAHWARTTVVARSPGHHSLHYLTAPGC